MNRKHEEKEVLFADTIVKMNRKCKLQVTNDVISNLFITQSIQLSKQMDIQIDYTIYTITQTNKLVLQLLHGYWISPLNLPSLTQERILLLTERSLYNIDPVSCKPRRRIGLLDISAVKMSGLQDNFFVICVPTEYDYLFISRYFTAHATARVTRLSRVLSRACVTCIVHGTCLASLSRAYFSRLCHVSLSFNLFSSYKVQFSLKI